MRVFLHSDTAERSPSYLMTVSPAADTDFVKPADCLPEWSHPAGGAKQIEVIFVYGVAEVPDVLGRYMTARGLAHRTRLLRRIAKLFDRHGQPIEEVFDAQGARIMLDDKAG